MGADGKALHMQRNSNATKSFIEDASEDFTNIEEHIQLDARISCRNMVDTVSKFVRSQFVVLRSRESS